MTDLLPIVFARGQNESIDPRIAPVDAHAIARNVRWRKDGRPAKRYGVTSVSTTNLGSPLTLVQANAIASLGGAPVLALASSVRQLTSLGWTVPATAADENAGDLSHWGPGEREVIARDEHTAIQTVSSGYSQGFILHAWDASDGNTYYSVKNRDGALVISPRLLIAGKEPRVISTTNFAYVLTKNGATLDLRVFDPTTLTITAAASPGTLLNATNHFDAVGVGTTFAIVYESAAGLGTVKLFSATSTPTATSTNNTNIGITGTNARFGVIYTAGGNMFVSAVEAAGRVVVWSFGSTLVFNGAVAVETDVSNIVQPGMFVYAGGSILLVWGGVKPLAGPSFGSSYTRACVVTSAPAVSGSIGTFYGVSPISKPFFGPAFTALGVIDGNYLWVSSANGSGFSTSPWDDQRAVYLMKLSSSSINTTLLRRQMHVPNLPPDIQTVVLSDFLALGTGYGYLTPFLNAVRYGNGQNPTLGFDAVTYHSIYENTQYATRDVVTAGKVLQFTGGSFFEFGGAAEETGFSNFPVLAQVTGGAGGSMSVSSSYIYRAVYEWLDGSGRRHRSAASDPLALTTGPAETSATIVAKPLIADAHYKNASAGSTGFGVTLHIYRTLAGQSTFHRVTPNVGAPMAAVAGADIITYVDLMSDATASEQEVLYTDGGVLDNTLAPPSTFACVCNARVWLGGQLDRNVITASKLLVDGEPTQFSDLDAFSVFLPEKCTALASIDGTVVAFARERIYFVTGDGPNDQGIGSFNPPTELPTDVGCIDWRSVVETSIGVFFLSKRGIYLLPRGFNTPVYVGAEVETTLAQYPKMVSATLVSIPSNDGNSLGEITVRFVVGSDDIPTATSVLVYDLRTGGWSVDDYGNGPRLSGTWSDAFITTRFPSGVLALQSESAAAGYTDFFGTFIITTLGTGDIRPFGVAGYGRFCSVVLVGEFRASSKVNVQVSVDGAAPDTFTFAVTAADDADGNVYLDVTPKNQLGSSLRVTCFDAGNPTASSPTEGFIMQALFIETDLIGKTKRLAAARRL